MKIVFLDAQTLGSDIDLSVFAKYGDLAVFERTLPNDIVSHIGDGEIVIVNKLCLGEENLSHCKCVKLICVTATGFDNIDTEYCKENGIAVCNVVGYSTHNVAQVTVAMVLSLISRLTEYTRSVADGTYSSGKSANILTPIYNEIYGKTWGIVGYGNIGREVGRVADALGCNIVVYKRTPVSYANCVDIDELCRVSDVISIHTPLNDGTRGLIDRRRISLMKKSAILINVARGAVIDEYALADAVIDGRLGGVGIDVYSTEPFPTEHPYSKIVGFDNVLMTPHMAWGSYEARKRCCNEICLNIESFLKGEERYRIV